MKSTAQTNLSLKSHISMEAIEPEGSRVLLGSDKLTWTLALSLTLGKLFNLAKSQVPDLQNGNYNSGDT